LLARFDTADGVSGLGEAIDGTPVVVIETVLADRLEG
jgi:hypothetical protein